MGASTIGTGGSSGIAISPLPVATLAWLTGGAVTGWLVGGVANAGAELSAGGVAAVSFFTAPSGVALRAGCSDVAQPDTNNDSPMANNISLEIALIVIKIRYASALLHSNTIV
jgi:hypothetical protein